MRKLHPVLFLFVILALLVTACGQMTPPEAATSQPQPTSTTAEQPTETQVVIETPANTELPATEQVAVISTAPVKAECRVDNSAQVDAEMANRFPKVGDVEWSKGAETAFVTIEEYSDFQ